MLQVVVFKPVNTEWVGFIVFTTEKNGPLRLSLDYRKRNAVKMKDLYLLPRMGKCTDSLGEVRILSTLDAISWYWQINIDEPDG